MTGACSSLSAECCPRESFADADGCARVFPNYFEGVDPFRRYRLLKPADIRLVKQIVCETNSRRDVEVPMGVDQDLNFGANGITNRGNDVICKLFAFSRNSTSIAIVRECFFEERVELDR